MVQLDVLLFPAIPLVPTFQFLMVQLDVVLSRQKHTCKSIICKCKDRHFLDKKSSNADSMFLPEVRRLVYIQDVNHVFQDVKELFVPIFYHFLRERRLQQVAQFILFFSNYFFIKPFLVSAFKNDDAVYFGVHDLLCPI